jgi:hypothetical protein
MQICDSFTRILLVYLTVPGWNSESSKLVPHFWMLALVVRCLDLIWRLLSLRLKILSTNLIILLATLFYPLLENHVFLSRVLAGIVLESPDQKTRGFVVQIALSR